MDIGVACLRMRFHRMVCQITNMDANSCNQLLSNTLKRLNMKPHLPEEDLLLREMTDCLPALYFPENGDDDLIHALARKEFSEFKD